jgi:hypothetical protein
MRRRGGLALRDLVTDRQLDCRFDTAAPLVHVQRHLLRVRHASLGAEVTRRGRGRETPLPHPLGKPRQRLVDGQHDRDLDPRRDVADVLGEEVCALLIEQRRRSAVDQGLFVALSRGPAAIDLAADHPLADPDLVAGNRAARRQRELVGQLERLIVGIAEDLAQLGAGEAARRFGANLDGPKGQLLAIGADQPTAVTSEVRVRHCSVILHQSGHDSYLRG